MRTRHRPYDEGPIRSFFNTDIAPVVLEWHVPGKRCGVRMMVWSRPIHNPVAGHAQYEAHPSDAIYSRVGRSPHFPPGSGYPWHEVRPPVDVHEDVVHGCRCRRRRLFNPDRHRGGHDAGIYYRRPHCAANLTKMRTVSEINRIGRLATQGPNFTSQVSCNLTRPKSGTLHSKLRRSAEAISRASAGPNSAVYPEHPLESRG
jgi:hypothetical protein